MDNIHNNQKLVLTGGRKSVTLDQDDMFTWPIVTDNHEEAVLKVLRAGKMSGFDVSKEFEEKFAAWHGVDYALTSPNGTSSILEGMFALGIGCGDEVICPSITYWASIVQAYLLRGTPVFAEIDPETLTIAPEDIERKITPRTRAIVVVHYAGVPADMDWIMAIAQKHQIKVLEDCSHAHGSTYNGRLVGTFGDAGAFSLMTGKSFAIGEGGILITRDRAIYERAILWGHYIRHGDITLDEIKKYAGIPCGGAKNRMHQLSSAFGLVQLENYPAQMQEIDDAMSYFCDQLEGLPGIGTMRTAAGYTFTKGGWYYPHFRYISEQLGGLSLSGFAEAVAAEGTVCNAGCNKPLHLHPLFTEMDVFREGKPTRTANLQDTDDFIVEQSLPVSENIPGQVFEVPWFKHFRKDVINQHVDAYKKVINHADQLLEGDDKRQASFGGYSSFFKSSSNSK